MCSQRNLLGYFFFIFLTSITYSIGAEIKVDSLDDDGASGTLRESIRGAADGDVVLLRAEGDLLLDPIRGPIVVNHDITISGQGGPAVHRITGDGIVRIFEIPSVNTVTISRLTLDSGRGIDGGAILSRGTLTLNSVRIKNSIASASGGAVYQETGSLWVNNSYFFSNGAGGNGGAIYVNGAPLTVTSTGFEDNTATGAGGAIGFSAASAEMDIRSSTFSANSSGFGGGIALLSGSASAVNLTMLGNELGDGTLSHIDAGVEPFSLANSLFVGTAAGLAGISGTFTDGGNNFSGTDVELGLGQLGDYGGVSPTYLLLPGSPAIDAGENSHLPATDRDQRGLARFSDGDGDGGGNVVDAGAFEIQHYQVSAIQIRGSATGGVDDGGFGNPFDPSDDADSIASADVFVKLTRTGKADIGDAVGANNAAGGGSVSFASKIVPGRIFLKGSELEVRRDLAFYGPGATQMTIDGDARSPVMRVGEGALAYIKGLSIENGLAETGAGIVVDSGGRVALEEVSVSGNAATLAGGGIAVVSGDTYVFRSSLVGNTAGLKGGALYATSDADVTIDTSTISGNSAVAQGGGISAAGSLTIDSSALVDNTAATAPGLVMEGGSARIKNSIFSQAGVDSVELAGGAVASDGYNISDAPDAALAGPIDQTSTDPLLDPISLNGGTTLSYAPQSSSPAINAGENLNPPEKDQPGLARVRGGTIDVGPVEFQNDPPTVDCPLPASVDCVSSSGASVQIISIVDDLDGDDVTVVWKRDGTIVATQTIAGSSLPATLDKSFDFPIGDSTLTITASDAYASSGCTVPVSVDDKVAPVVTLNGDSVIKLECNVDTYTELNATASDTCDGSVDVVVTGSVNTSSNGDYTITYSATDAAGNIGTATRTVTVQDTTAPVVTLNGPSLITLECNVDTYTEQSATALDACDGSVDVVVTGSVNTSSNGDYTITYSATDAAGNIGTATRTVTVQDTTAPVVTLNGPSLITLECNVDTYTEQSATALDACDGSVDVVVTGSVNTSSNGDYTITYSATDAAGNIGTATRTVTVQDTTAPVVTLNGPSLITLECNVDTYTEQSATALDACDGSVAVVVTGSVNTSLNGDYTITYSATDAAGNIGTATRTVTVQDTLDPVVTLNGSASITLECNVDAYTEQSATAEDACDGIVTVDTSGSVDAGSLGTYTITYSATDAAGNTGTATRTVTVQDTLPPVVTLNGPSSITLECSVDSYTESGASALDLCQGVVLVVITGSVDVTTNGDYSITYNATDASGNTGTATRTVTVQDTLPPVVTLNGPTSITLECNIESYTELNASALDACDGSVTVNITGSVDTGTLGSYTVTYIATDASGNPASTSRTVTVVDTTAPTFDFQLGNATVPTDPGYCSALIEFAVTASDNCEAAPVISYAILSNPAYPEGVADISSPYRFPPIEGIPGTEDAWLTHEVVYTATDASGNAVSDSFFVTVSDEFQNCAFNVSWPNALPLDITASQQESVTSFGEVRQFLALTDQARWYKFNVQPGSRITVVLTELPANFDVVVYKDIEAEYLRLLELFNSTDPEEQELSLLGVEFAPESFSPESFSPESFSPESFSPESFSPESFSPESFSPESFSPESFSPESFSPESFSPESFSPESFSPESFSPESFSPESFSPESFSPESFSALFSTPESFSPESFSSAQISSMIAYSAFPGVASEGVSFNTFTLSGDFYIRVRGSNGSFNTEAPFKLTVVVQPEICDGITGPEGLGATTMPAPIAGGYNSLIVWDSSRMAGDAAFEAKLDLLAQHAGVNGAVIDVSEELRVVNANLQADENPGCPYAKNLVASEIKAIIDGWRDVNPSLEYIVVLGSDDDIPFFRTTDEAFLANEANYIPPVKDNTQSQSSLRYGQILTQDPYGAACELNLVTGPYPYPELAVGRLVESVEDISAQIDNFIAIAGLLQPTTGLVTGYDFLDDAARAVQFEFEGALGGPVDSLIADATLAPSEGWTASQLADAFLGSRHDLVFLAGHFSTGSSLAADYETRLTAAQVLNSDADLLNTLIFSVGCHSGYNTVDEDAINGVTKQPDWAQTFAKMGATLIAGTGYQYGDTEFIEYSERLYLEFARQLRTGTGPVSVGKALNEAKRKYLAETPLMRGIHEKSLVQATLFGLPMLQVNVPGTRIGTSSQGIDLGVAPVLVPPYSADFDGAGNALGLKTADISITPTLSEQSLVLNVVGETNSTVTARWFEGSEGIASNPAEPVRPLEVYLVSAPNTLLRGVGFRGGSYDDLEAFLPLTGAPTTEIRGVFGNFFSEVFFPVQPYSLNYFGAICGGTDGERLNVYPTQFLAYGGGELGGTLRKYSDMDFRLYYNDNTEIFTNDDGDTIIPALASPPSIARVTSTDNGSSADFAINVLGSPAAGIHEVWITYTELDVSTPAGEWVSLDLIQDSVDSTLWTGTLPLNGAIADDIRFMVQAVTGTGLVALNTNLGHYYEIGVDGFSVRIPTRVVDLSGPASAAYGEDIRVSAKLEGYDEGSDTWVALDGKRVGFRVATSTVNGFTEQGLIALDLPINTRPATGLLLQAYYPGDRVYAPSAVNQLINLTKQTTALTFIDPPLPDTPVLGSEIVVALADGVGTPLKERTVFFLVDYGNGIKIGNSVITDFLGRADLSEIFLPSGTATITAYFNDITLPDDSTVLISDELYEPALPVSIDVTLVQPIREDSLGFDPQQVDVYYKSSGNGKNAPAPIYENASISGDVGFNVPLQPEDLLVGLPDPNFIEATVEAWLSGELIGSETVVLDTRGNNGNHWTTTSRPGEEVSYVGIHWNNAPRFDSALSESPGPRILTTFIGNSFTEFQFVPVQRQGTYTTQFPNGGPTIVVKNGNVDVDASTGLIEGDYGLDTDGLTFDVKYGLKPGMVFTTTGSKPSDPVETVLVEDGVNYLEEGGRMIVRLASVDGTPQPASDATPNQFVCRIILGGDDGVQVRSIARIGEGIDYLPWSSDEAGHKQYRP